MENKIVIDNALDQQSFDALYDHMMGTGFEWYFNPGIVRDNQNDYQFVHGIDNGYYMTSPHNYSFIFPINDILAPQSIIRTKANLTGKTDKVVVHGFHHDVHAPGSLTAVYYVNSNDGYTEFEDGDKVHSVANRLVIFPSRLKHSGTSCTNQQRRVVINFNYIPWRDNKYWQQLMTPEDIKYRQHWEQGMNLPTDSKGVPVK